MAYNRKSTEAGVAVGAGPGTAVGVALRNLGVWLAVSVAIGMLLSVWRGKQTVASSEDQKERT